jgi:hypothetical protein
MLQDNLGAYPTPLHATAQITTTDGATMTESRAGILSQNGKSRILEL